MWVQGLSGRDVLPSSPASFAVLISRAMSGQASDIDREILVKLKDKDLLRVQGYIGGQWRDAGDKGTLDVCLFSFISTWV